MTDSELIKKSIRLPTDLVEYVEQQEGRDFSKKLVGILIEFRDGESQREKVLENYEKCIEENRHTLDKQACQMWEASKVLCSLAGVLSDAKRMIN